MISGMPGDHDKHIEAAIRQAQALIEKLKLTDEEQHFAVRHAQLVHESATAAYLALGDDQIDRMRALSIAAAVALALVTVSNWANKTDSDFFPKPE